MQQMEAERRLAAHHLTVPTTLFQTTTHRTSNLDGSRTGRTVLQFMCVTRFTCCVAPNDFNTGKTTCRPSYDCYNPNYQNTGSTGPSTGNTNQGYQNTGTSPTTQSQNSQNTDSTSLQTGNNGAPSFASQYDGTDNANQQGGMSRASSSFIQGDPSTNDNSNAGNYDSYAQDNSVSSSSSCVYGAWACGQDGVTLFQCSYVQGNVLSWRQHSQCQQGLICSNKSGAGGNGFVGCDYPNGGASSGQIGQTNQGNQGQQNNNGTTKGNNKVALGLANMVITPVDKMELQSTSVATDKAAVCLGLN
ncbi:hypothetical protein BCR33DRAFT_850916 [Rhizoclosmatium globosum]|uniref:Uncharacterized protein n=1 Tax=Rhizoclosmatium globosum TaxID=329046 RepID=A0A1Y2CBJ5_9FUNG|nr:hypothetical protein BCR33DRAFT_850916 [Rhizoclosmatium globosum]|eukprot:ORY43705.1 hypothetical protein BCR33DRAFT_850916 [Rhizoclosmatium globosum]